MKLLNLFSVPILCFSSLNACSVQSSTPNEILNKNEKIIYSIKGGTYEITQSNTTPHKINTPDNFQSFVNLQFSPNGQQIVYSLDGDNSIYVMNISNKEKIKIDNISLGIFPRWSSDSKKIVFTYGNNIYSVNSDGKNLIKLTDSTYENLTPCFSPNGTKIAFLSDRDSTKREKFVYVMNSDSTNTKRLTTDISMSGGGIDWLSNDQLLYTNSNTLYSIKIDGSNVSKLNNSSNLSYDTPKVSQDGKKILFTSKRDGNREVYIRNIRDNKDIKLTSNNTNDSFQFPTWINE